MKFALGAMTVGDILDRGAKILLRRLGTFFTINLLLLWPVLLVELAVPVMPLVYLLVLPLIIVVVALIFGQVASGATITVISKEYVDEPVSAGTAISGAFKRLGPLLSTVILYGLILMLGFLMLVIPFFIFLLNYALSGQVVMLEGLSGGAALRRSKELTYGYRSRIFGIMLLVGLLTGILQGGVAVALVTSLPPGGQYNPVTGDQMPYNHPNFEINQVANFLVQVLTGAYQAVCLTLVYFDLRVRKEGFDLEIAARQSLTP